MHGQDRPQSAAAVGVALLVAGTAPLAADFNDVLQVICDADSPIAGDCDLTPDGLKFAHSLAISPDDKHVYICSSQADVAGEEPLQKETLSAFARAMDGTLTLVDQEIEDSGGVTTLGSCRGVAVSPDGKHVYTAALADSAVTWFARDAMAGTLTLVDAIVSGGPGGDIAGAAAVAVSPDDEHVYVLGRSGDTVAAYSRNTASGDLTHLATYEDDTGIIVGLGAPEGLAISPDGEHVYVASEDDNAVAVFARDADFGSGTFGELTFVEAKFDGVGGVNGLNEAGTVTLDPSGDSVYVGSQTVFDNSDWFAAFSRDSGSGALTFLQSFQSADLSVSINCSGVGPTNVGLGVSPDGLFVAVAEPFHGAIATFSRAADGSLTFAEAICDDLFVMGDELGAIVQMAASADGENLYTAGGAFSLFSVIDYECDSADVDLVLTLDSVSEIRTETACRSVEMGPMYHVLAAGDLTVTSPQIAIGNDVSFDGLVRLSLGVP